jgi:hypothetical protein
MSRPATAPTLVLPDLLQGRWSSTVVVTFGADLSFFNAKLVGQLAQVPLRLILADGEQLTRRLHEAATTGQRLPMTNRSYLATPIRHTSAAHAKAILLLAQHEGLLAVGSGNLGQDGYASPGELWHVFRYHDDQAQHLAEFTSVRFLLDGLEARSLLDPPAAELLQTVWSTAPWLPPPSPSAPQASVRHNLDRPLVTQLAEVVDWPVQELVAYAPFHDPDCAALSTLIETFSPTKVTALVSKDTSVDPRRLMSVLASAKRVAVQVIEVAAEPATYIHAKWVHLRGKTREALLTGSANLSRSALLRPAADGNIETGVITTAAPGGFASLYNHLRRTATDDLAGLGLSIQPTRTLSTTPEHPVVLWSRLDRNKLTVSFDRPVGLLPITIRIGGDILNWSARRVTGPVVEFDLDEPSARQVADGGPMTVEVEDENVEPGYTWPYQVDAIRHRLDKAGRRDQLTRIAHLPETDNDLLAFLQELEATLIFDPVSAWRVAKPGTEQLASDEDGGPVTWDQLDWGRVRRDPRYTGYLARGLPAGSSPTDIQVILAAITGRLQEIATVPPTEPTRDDEDELAHEGETEVSPDDEDAQDERQDELTRRALPTSTRTRMAFNRFVKRYSAATRDDAFINELGPVVAVTNAVIFNHLLIRLIEREAVDPTCATEAQVSLWRRLWGASDGGGLLAQLDPAERSAADKVLVDSRARETTLRALARSRDLDLESAAEYAIRDQARHLIVNQDFGLDELLVATTEPRAGLAAALLELLVEVVSWSTERELNEFVVGPLGLTNADVEWRHDKVGRPTTAGYVELLTDVLVVHTPVAALTPAAVHEALERLAVASYLGGWNIADYLRIRFEGNGKDVGFWDDQAGMAVVLVNGETYDFQTFNPPWPEWLCHIEGVSQSFDPGLRS